MKSGRKSSGNMLTLVVLILGVIIAVGVAGFIFNSLLFQRSRAQYEVDALAVALANKINFRDRVGQLNELEERSRELVFTSRQRVDSCGDDLDFLEPVCEELLKEARDGQSLVEKERKNQIKLITDEIRASALSFNRTGDQNGVFSLKWLETYKPTVRTVRFGRIDKTESNVKDTEVLTELAEFDYSHHYLNNDTKLFKADCNAKLPNPDEDLDFRFAPLPAYIKKTCSPARNVNPEVFRTAATVVDNGKLVPCLVEDIPNAVQLTCTMDVAFGADHTSKTPFELYSTGSTNGAFAEPD